MKLSIGRDARRAPVLPALHGVLAAVCAIALAGCTHDGRPDMASLQPRGATVAFESIDGPPPAQFQTLVRNLNDEAQSRRLAVLSREGSSAYRVRGYLFAEVAKGRTKVSWVWDVFDREQNRALRIDGEEIVKDAGKDGRDAWKVADDAMLRRIARSSMERLAAFLTSPEVAPGEAAQAALTGVDDSSPEAAGIFRIFQPHADPARSAPTAGGVAATPPPRRDEPAAVSAAESRAQGADQSLALYRPFD